MPPWQPRIIKKLQKKYEAEDMRVLYGMDNKEVDSRGSKRRKRRVGKIPEKEDTSGRDSSLLESQGKEDKFDEQLSRSLSLGQATSDREACVQGFSESTKSKLDINARGQANLQFDLNKHDSGGLSHCNNEEHVKFRTHADEDNEKQRMFDRMFGSVQDQSDACSLPVDLNFPTPLVRETQEHQGNCIEQSESYGQDAGNDVERFPNINECYQPCTGTKETKLVNGLNSSVMSVENDTSRNNFHQNDDHLETQYGSAVWDIFRRQDVPKLTEYLNKHYREFRHFCDLPVESVSIAYYLQ